MPRNNFVGEPIHRVDLRIQQRFPLGGRVSIDGILEVFNVFNHANYGNYEVRESNANYGKPIRSAVGVPCDVLTRTQAETGVSMIPRPRES